MSGIDKEYFVIGEPRASFRYARELYSNRKSKATESSRLQNENERQSRVGIKKIRQKSRPLQPIRQKIKGDLKGQENKKNRMEVVMIDGVTYRVVAEEKSFATQTPYNAICRLIHNNKERICCLGPDGGK